MYEQTQTGVVEGDQDGRFANTDWDRLDNQGQLCAADIRATLTGIRDDGGVNLAEILADAPVVPSEVHGHVCNGSDACYPAGRPDGAQACRPLDDAEQARLRRGYALASAVVSGAIDYRTLQEIK